MSKLKKDRLDQMIEIALSYKQEGKEIKSNILFNRLREIILKPSIYGLTFASLIISCVFIPQIVTSRNLVDINEINDLVTYGIIEDFWFSFFKNKRLENI